MEWSKPFAREARRDRSEFDQLVRRCHRQAYNVAYRMAGNHADAEDLTQEAFLRAHRERDTVRDPRAMLSWLYRVATHVSLDRLRQRTSVAARQSSVDLAELDPPDRDAPSLEQGIGQEQMSSCVQSFVVGIPDTYRSVILLHTTCTG